jgi:hypothetical protein
MAIVTAATVLDLTDLTSDDTDQVTALLAPVSAFIESYTGRAFERRTVTELHRGGLTTLFLRTPPLATVTSVTDVYSSDVIASTGYAADTEMSVIRRLPYNATWSGSYPEAPRYQVIYEAGPGTAPEDIQMAAVDLIRAYVRASGGIQSEKEGDYSYALAGGDLPPNVRLTLDQYRTGPV